LVLNAANPAIAALMDGSLADEAVDEAICTFLVSAMLQGRAPVSAELAALLSGSLQRVVASLRSASIAESAALQRA
jgi:hypothetical protein